MTKGNTSPAEAERTTYRCAGCGSAFRQPVWGALELPEAESKCPVCRSWARFVAVTKSEEQSKAAA